MTFINTFMIVIVITECLTGSYIPTEKTSILAFTASNNQKINVQHKKLPRNQMRIDGNEENESLEVLKKSRAHEDIRPSGRINRQEPKVWDQWGKWSKCSVTCGIGKIARWRHCIGGTCSSGEKKAQLRTCTSAAC